MKTKSGKSIDDDIAQLASSIASEEVESILAFGLPHNRIEYKLALALQAERDSFESKREELLNHYYQDQGISPDGELRPLVSKLLARVEKLEKENGEILPIPRGR